MLYKTFSKHKLRFDPGFNSISPNLKFILLRFETVPETVVLNEVYIGYDLNKLCISILQFHIPYTRCQANIWVQHQSHITRINFT